MVRDQVSGELDSLLKNYLVTHVDPKKILIKLEFIQPLKVSAGEMPHVLYIQTQLS